MSAVTYATARAACVARYGEPTWSGCYASEWCRPSGKSVALRSEPGALLLTTFSSQGAQGDGWTLTRNGRAITPLPAALDAADAFLRTHATTATKGP